MYKVALIVPKRSEPGYLVHRMAVDLDMICLETYLSSQMDDIETLVTDELEDVIKFNPDLLGVSAVSASYPLAIKAAEEVKKRCGCVAIIGGIHITTCPESFSDTFELGVIGEGEEVFHEVVSLFKSGKSGPKEYRKIAGIVFKEDGKIVQTKAHPQITDLGKLPIPNRRKWIEKIGIPFLMTTRKGVRP